MGAGLSGRQAVPSLSSSASRPGDGSRPGLGDLPESCLALILSCLDPLEICGLALVNRAFRLASSADCVWEPKLPSSYKILVDKLFQTSSTASTAHDRGQNDHRHPQISTCTYLAKKDIYARLCCPNRLGGDTMEVWIDKAGGGLCVAISWKALKITGITDRRYWSDISTDESRFQSVAYLKQIWWLQVEGKLELEFPAGSYSLYFRMQLGRSSSRRLGQRVCTLDGVRGWNAKPVHFQSWSSSGHRTTTQYYLKEPAAAKGRATAAGPGGGGGRWMMYHAGDFVVEEECRNRTQIDFSMTQIDCTHAKGGLSLDCVLIYPTNTKLLRSNSQLPPY